MHDDKQVDSILHDIEKQNMSRMIEKEVTKSTEDDFLVEGAKKKREEQVKSFELNLYVEDIVADEVKNNASDNAENNIEDLALEQVVEVQEKPKKNKNKTISRVLYAMFVVLFSVIIAAGGILFFFEASGMNASSEVIAVEIPVGAYTGQIADILTDKGVIRSPLLFRVYSKVTKSDGLWQFGTFMLSADMGYTGIVEELQTATPRENVNVTIPEGFTVDEIATLLDEKGVCSKEDFYYAVVNGVYDYDFVKAIPTAADGQQHAGRIYRLEGYLFPDTYNFYIGSSGEMVVEKMLENFDKKLTPTIRLQIKNKGWTVDEAIIFASIIQGEAGLPEDMVAVSRVLTNRMQPNSGYPKLECCSTRDYVNAIFPSVPGVEVTTSAYNTYIREGLPVGAINNPGLQAIEAALQPSNDEKYADCYFFATDYDTGITYFSQTFSQHVAICNRYKIGMYG